jgi:hypothetical protein
MQISSTRPAACARRLSGMARRASGADLRRRTRGGGRRTRQPRAARPAREHAQDHAGKGARRLAHLNPQPARWSPNGLRISSPPKASSRPSHPSRCSSRAAMKFRTRARSSRRFFRREGGRTGARSLRRLRRQDARARRHHGQSRPDFRLRRRHRAALRRSTTGSSARARAMCRCAARAERRMCWPISPAAWTWC